MYVARWMLKRFSVEWYTVHKVGVTSHIHFCAQGIVKVPLLSTFFNRNRSASTVYLLVTDIEMYICGGWGGGIVFVSA